MKSYLDYWKITFICGKITVTIGKITLISGKLHFSFENNLFIGKITLIIEKSPLLMQNHLCYWKITSISGKPPLLMENHLFLVENHLQSVPERLWMYPSFRQGHNLLDKNQIIWLRGWWFKIHSQCLAPPRPIPAPLPIHVLINNLLSHQTNWSSEGSYGSRKGWE